MHIGDMGWAVEGWSWSVLEEDSVGFGLGDG